MMLIERKWSMPNGKTFRMTPIRELIRDELVPGTVLDPFANEASIREVMTDEQTYITNDLDPAHDTDYTLDAIDFLKQFGDRSVDMVLYDPPYSPRQIADHYADLGKTVNMQTTQSSYWARQKVEIARILKPGGKVITCGWNSGGMGKKHGFKIKRILLVPHGSWHNDTICTVEVKDPQATDQQSLF